MGVISAIRRSSCFLARYQVSCGFIPTQRRQGVPMFCSKCGAQIDDQAQFCPQCGTTSPVMAQPPAPPPGPPTQQPPYAVPGQYVPQYTPPQPTDGKATASLVLGILSVICFGILAGIPALILGHISRSNLQKSRAKLKDEGPPLSRHNPRNFRLVTSTLILPAHTIPRP